MKTENCHHQYSKSISEPRPRKCVRCGHIEDWKPEPLPQTPLSQTIPVNRFDVKQFLANIAVQISILTMLNKTGDAKHWRDMDKAAHKMLGIPYNSTDPKTQKEIDEAVG